MNNQRLATLRAKKWYHILPVKTGQMLEVHEKVWQWSVERIWKFRWLVIKVKKPNHVDGTFVMRGKVAGHTIEKIYPLSFGKFEKVLLIDVYRTRRAKLYYIRDKVGKDAKMKSLATAEEKWVDLLALAVAEATEFSAEFAAPAEETVETSTEETAEAPAEETVETSTEETAEAPAEEAVVTPETESQE
jgi:large subunit ribosomal protein L19